MSRKPRPLVLSEADCQQLAHAAERHDNWRTRQRCRTLLMLHSGKPINTIACEQGIERDTVAAHRDAWLKNGFAGLVDAPRSGAPRKFPVEHLAVLCEWARAEALTAPQLREKLQQHCGLVVSNWVVQSSLLREGFVWKRTRHSLKKNETSPLLALPAQNLKSSKPKPSAES